MNRAEELHGKIFRYAQQAYVKEKIFTFGYSVKDSVGYYKELRSGGNMYCYLFATCKLLSPGQIVEMGADAGASTMCMSMGSPSFTKIYSADKKDGAWSLVPSDNEKIVKCSGDYLDLNIWPKELDFVQTDIWFFDGDHGSDHVRTQFETYNKFFKPNCVLLLDDINFYRDVFNEIGWDKLSIPQVHDNGFGIVVI